MASWFVLIVLFQTLSAQSSPQPTPNPGANDIEPIRTSITVTEHVAMEAPANVTTLDSQAVRETPGVNLDDRLRQTPGFSLFRRTSSLVAHPTTQGVSLRGLGSTGASRTLVLWDGIPMNDPFGGWVYWTRMPPEEIDRAEVSRGASTSLFGDRAMAGAISLLSKDPEKHMLTAGYEAGNKGTHELTVGLADVWKHFAASTFVRAFSTDGYFIVPGAFRGSVDTPAGVDFVAGNARFDVFGGAHRFFAKLDIVAEDRANGTVLQHNSTSLGTLSGNYSWQRGRDGISVLGFHTREEFHSSFSSISADRNTERLTYTQRVPSQATGGSAFWTHSGTSLNTLFGGDIERDQGSSIDSLVPTGQRIGGGNRLEHGLFGQANFGTRSARLFVGARQTFTGDNTFFSPSGGFVLGRGRLRARGSVYRSFRAPTLNELYRDFRAGNAATLANPALEPETLFGAEAGFDYAGEGMRLGVTAFRNSMDRLITNVTLQSGAMIVRQRQNAGAALARGFEVDLRKNWRNINANFAYMYVDSRYATGLRIPEVPKNQGSAQVSYVKNGTMLSAGFRSYSSQFDDDLNQFLLPGFATIQFAARQRITRGLSAVLDLENVLDRTFYVAYTPTPSIGAPRLWRAGLKWEGRLW